MTRLPEVHHPEGTRETIGDTLILLALLALLGGTIGRQAAVLFATAPILVAGLLLRRGQPLPAVCRIRIPTTAVPMLVVLGSVSCVLVAIQVLVLS